MPCDIAQRTRLVGPIKSRNYQSLENTWHINLMLSFSKKQALEYETSAAITDPKRSISIVMQAL